MVARVKDILIAAVGLTPQVVTETLWALHHRQPPLRISEIWFLTTLAGRERCLKELLAPEAGRFYPFCREFGLLKRWAVIGWPSLTEFAQSEAAGKSVTVWR